MTHFTRYFLTLLCLWLGLSAEGLAQLSIASGETIKVTSPDELVLLEDLVNNTTIDNLTLGGTAAQSISGTGTIGNLKLNKASGTATILSGSRQTLTGTFTPTAGTLATNGGLTLKSDASGSARIGVGSESGGYITGNVVTQRYLTREVGGSRTGRAWRLVSIPVTGNNTLREYFMGGRDGADLTVSGNRNVEPANLGTVVIGHNQPSAGAANPTYDWIGVAGQVSSLRYYLENPTTGSFASTQVPDLTTQYTNAQQGYMIFARGDRKQDYQPPATSSSSTTLQATGELKQGTIEVTIPPLASAGFVLVGNPFVSPIDMELIRNDIDNNSIIQNTFYIWDSRINGSLNQGGYRTIVRDESGAWTATGGGVGSNPQYIESHTAFFVKPTATGGRLKIKESHKVDGTPGIFPHGTSAGLPARLFVNLEVPDSSARGLVDGSVLFFDGRYSDAMGDVVDIPAMFNMNSGVMGLRQSGQRLAMEGRPWPTDTITHSVPVDMRNLRDESYELRLIAERLTKDGFRAWLLDNHLKKETELKPDGETFYPFRRTGNIATDSSRFEIVYRMTKSSTPGSLTPDDAATISSLKVYPNPSRSDGVKLALGTLPAGRYEVRVLDMAGRLMATQRIDHPGSGAVHSLGFAKRMATGRYMVQIGGPDGNLVETLSWLAE